MTYDFCEIVRALMSAQHVLEALPSMTECTVHECHAPTTLATAPPQSVVPLWIAWTLLCAAMVFGPPVTLAPAASSSSCE